MSNVEGMYSVYFIKKTGRSDSTPPADHSTFDIRHSKVVSLEGCRRHGSVICPLSSFLGPLFPDTGHLTSETYKLHNGGPPGAVSLLFDYTVAFQGAGGVDNISSARRLARSKKSVSRALWLSEAAGSPSKIAE